VRCRVHRDVVVRALEVVLRSDFIDCPQPRATLGLHLHGVAPSGILGIYIQRKKERERESEREIPAFPRLSIIDVFEAPKAATLRARPSWIMAGDKKRKKETQWNRFLELSRAGRVGATSLRGFVSSRPVKRGTARGWTRSGFHHQSPRQKSADEINYGKRPPGNLFSKESACLVCKRGDRSRERERTRGRIRKLISERAAVRVIFRACKWRLAFP